MSVVIQLMLIIVVFIVISTIWIFLMSTPDENKTKINMDDIIANFDSYPPELWFSNTWKVFELALAINPYHYTVAESSGKVIYDNRTPESEINLLPNYNKFAESIRAYNTDSKKGNGLVRNMMREWAIAVTMDSIVRLVHVEAGLN